MRTWLAQFATVAILMLSLTACDHHSAAKSKASTPAKSSVSTSTSAPSASCVIPQDNGGDHDADNNGGPDDGDGCDQ